MKAPEPKMAKMNLGQGPLSNAGQQTALKAVLAGGALVRAAEAHGGGGEDPDPLFGNLWICGIVLILIGAIWVSKAAFMSLRCCLKRLRGVVSRPPVQEEPYESEEEERTTPRRPRRQRTEEQQPVAHEDESATPTEEEETEMSEKPQRQGVSSREQTMTRRRSLSKPIRRRSGSASGSSSRTMRRSSSGPESAAARAAGEAAEGAERAAESAQMAADAATQAAESAEAATEMLRVLAGPQAASIQRIANSGPRNPWNHFQQTHAKRGWNMQQMRAEYYKEKSQRKVP